MQKYKILWADDEIDLLKPHILFLENKGYSVESVNNGNDALDRVKTQAFDLVFLDENMPGKSGLETLSAIKSYNPNIPVVMITKNEEEQIMEEAIGSKIADYLIKPLNPNQILLSVKKLLHNEQIVQEKTNLNYQQEFSNLSMLLNDRLGHDGWMDVYRKLVYWELEIDETQDKSMSEVLNMQKNEANQKFADFISDSYEYWLNGDDHPTLSHEVLEQKVFSDLGEDPVILIVIDNLRLDQWEIIEPEISRLFEIENKDLYFSILPTTTAYARNSLFAGEMPADIEKKYPEYWVGEDVDKPRNHYEKELLGENLKSHGLDKIKYDYHKIIQAKDGKHLAEHSYELLKNDLSAVVYNFVDMLSHARTDMQMIRELAPDESAYRALTKTWFNHSNLYETLKRISTKKVKVVLTTDHGTIRTRTPVKIVGDRNTNTNLRFKTGKNLAFNEKDVFFTRNPEKFKLPRLNVSSAYAFAVGDQFFAYPNNYNHYVNVYKDTFQHGGVSMEEIIVPLIVMRSKQ